MYVYVCVQTLLENQLKDQQLYYEKLLAQETVHALEESFQNIHINNNNNSNKINSKHSNSKNITNHSNKTYEFITENEMNEIENAKLEISMLEQQFLETLEQIK